AVSGAARDQPASDHAGGRGDRGVRHLPRFAPAPVELVLRAVGSRGLDRDRRRRGYVSRPAREAPDRGGRPGSRGRRRWTGDVRRRARLAHTPSRRGRRADGSARDRHDLLHGRPHRRVEALRNSWLLGEDRRPRCTLRRMSNDYRVAVVGATGQVGTLMLRLLREREFPVREIVPFASARSVGRELEGGLLVRSLDEESIQGFDLALFSAGGSTSGEWAPRFADAGAVVIDNSSRWRMHADVPLVVSEVNPDALAEHRGIVANPNCSTMQMVVALKPLHDEAGIERLVISTYQAVS